jgi:hypothetical protein
MPRILKSPIEWEVEKLICDCTGEMEHKFSTKYKAKPFTHVCPKCHSLSEEEDIYPKPVWRVV